jgi:hypothetical protein
MTTHVWLYCEICARLLDDSVAMKTGIGLVYGALFKEKQYDQTHKSLVRVDFLLVLGKGNV